MVAEGKYVSGATVLPKGAGNAVTDFNMGAEESELVRAAQNVAEARQRIADQLRRISRLGALGCSTTDAELTLVTFLGSLKIVEEHEQHLRELAEHSQSPRERWVGG
jgi:hypothetical protein